MGMMGILGIVEGKEKTFCVAALVATAAVVLVLRVTAVSPRRHPPAEAAVPSRARASKQQKRELHRAQRRRRKDELLRQRKTERTSERALVANAITEDQKRERMECIKMQRVEQYQKLETAMQTGLRVVVDLAFASQQSRRECHSILKQLGCIYGYMKKCPLDRLISLHVSNLTGPIAAMAQQHGLQNWKIHRHQSAVQDVYTPDEVIYLSPDASDVLTELLPHKVYVVGGIVDRSVRKGESLSRAASNGFHAMRLPLREWMKDVTQVELNIDAVLIILNEVANHGDWARAFKLAVPNRLATSKQPA